MAFLPLMTEAAINLGKTGAVAKLTMGTTMNQSMTHLYKEGFYPLVLLNFIFLLVYK